MKVLIVEPNASGHRLYYVRLLLEACTRAGVETTVLTSSGARAHQNWTLHLEQLNASFSVAVEDGDVYSAAVRMSKEIGADRTVIPDGDLLLQTLLRQGWPGNGRVSVLVMRAGVPSGPPVRRSLRSLAKRAIIIAASRRRNVDILVLRSPLTVRRGPFTWVADPVELAVTDDSRRSISALTAPYEMSAWVGVFGRITARKNLPLILGAFDHLPVGTGLLIGGTVDDDVEAEVADALTELQTRGTAVLRLSAPVSDEQLDSAIAAVDCVVAAHSNEGPSGIVAKAAAAGRYLVLSGARSLRKDAASLRGQAEWTALSAKAIGEAIARALSNTEPPNAPDLGSDEFTAFLVPESTMTSAPPGHSRQGTSN